MFDLAYCNVLTQPVCQSFQYLTKGKEFHGKSLANQNQIKYATFEWCTHVNENCEISTCKNRADSYILLNFYVSFARKMCNQSLPTAKSSIKRKIIPNYPSDT